ncbi:malto-oligosyltrehalose synthase [Paenarthrobacter sp. PH39-S1]|uniref:malto-oligosyltrehalose synthase n=1 Tax=Paenarthrobacter sp. PH39-S1 TaxID=3046204 RepID=UPI0024B8B062|nr:malto-oligosyltrehalose synthase [Paenarthrobacter sp. PH39-S1]MDJ0355844.1 malto-oligosyltrehalose synthase [Paenarthrobacter sp. PH39-S1]
MKTPASTYRLQIHDGFTLWDAAGQVDYLARLGADWLYLSPLLKAEAGSNHGYDVVDPSLLDPARGGEDALAALAAKAHAAGMGILLDIVPNHMGVATPAANPWWWSLLKEGRESRYAEAFDVDWDAGGGRIRLPVLGSAADLDALEVHGSELHYHEHRFPLADGSWGTDDGAEPDGAEPDGGARVLTGAQARAVHDRQHYELVDWRRADHDLNYRRFFAVNSLAGIRVEVPWVFDESHARILHWVRQGWVDGLRVDHPDGLADPAGYLRRLKDATDGAYLLIEKILEPGETLPDSLHCEGTTGYDALAQLDRIFVDPEGEAPLSMLDARLRGEECGYAELIHGTKRAVTDGMLNSEIRRLARLVPPGSPLSAADAEDALAEMIGNFDVYRTYLPIGLERLERAAGRARTRRSELGPALDILLPLLGGRPGAAPDAAAEGTRTGDQLAIRFQQTSGMVMAKGVEDCAFYQYTRLTSLTEVGADPAVWSVGTDEFHHFMAARHGREPLGMNALSTHDTKRGEDTRARISVLSELPAEWEQLLERLRELAPLPDGPLENLLWQSAVGAWPLSRGRLQGYAQKAAREAGNSTTWTAPDEAFERQLASLVDAAYDNPEVTALIDGFVDRIRPYFHANALGAKLLQLMIPGVPDVYQGSELYEQSLTDPDNRRPIDFDERRRRLAALDARTAGAGNGESSGDGAGVFDATADGSGGLDTGMAKLLVTSRALRLRRDRPELFTGYTPVQANGPAAGHLLAFDTGAAIAVATRLSRGLEADGGWRGTAVVLPYGCTDLLTGRTHPAEPVPVAEILTDFPVALLARTGD